MKHTMEYHSIALSSPSVLGVVEAEEMHCRIASKLPGSLDVGAPIRWVIVADRRHWMFAQSVSHGATRTAAKVTIMAASAAS